MKWGSRARREVIDFRADFNLILPKVMARVKLSEHGCWEWQGPKSELGYGTGYWRGKRYMLTRLVYAAVHGAFDKDMDVCHTCDNPGCCNPQHLFVASHAENMLDSINKGRHAETNQEVCGRGHPLSGDNVYVEKTGKSGQGIARHCKACRRIRNRARWRRLHPEVKRKAPLRVSEPTSQSSG